MKICIPVETDNGMDSAVCGHFGSAPMFLIVDVETLEFKTINNAGQVHQHGMCNPVGAIGDEKVDAVVVGGIGMGALQKLSAAGYGVFQAISPNVQGIVDAYKDGTLPRFSPQSVCGGHGNGQGCGH